MIKQVTVKEFDEEIKTGVVLVDFYADWCVYCKKLAPVLEKFSLEHKNISILLVNVDEEQELAMKYSISSIPTLMLYRDGKQIDVRQGVTNPQTLEEMIGE